MTFPIILTIIASFIWAITTHIDKYLLYNLKNNTSNINTVLVFSTLIAGISFSPIWLIISNFQVKIGLIPLIIIFLSSIIYIAGNYLYFRALEDGDPTIVAVMFQLIPVFSYILSFILFKEALSSNQIIGSILIILSAILISLEFTKTKNNNKLMTLLLMTLSSISYAIYFICFDLAVRTSNYNAAAFWFQIGLFLIGIVLFCFKQFKSPFIKMIKENGKKFIGLNITNEIVNIIANLLVNFANLTIPLAIANTLNGAQGAFVFLIGIIGHLIFPKIFTEKFDKKTIIQKILCIILGIIGLIIMFN